MEGARVQRHHSDPAQSRLRRCVCLWPKEIRFVRSLADQRQGQGTSATAGGMARLLKRGVSCLHHLGTVPSAPSRLEIGVVDFVDCRETSDYTEVSHEQEVHCSTVR